MASIVFECNLDDETMSALKELRSLRHQVLKKILDDINGTVKYLVATEAIPAHEQKSQTPQVQAEVKAKLEELEQRMQVPHIIFADEIEMYLDLLSSEPTH